MTRFYGIDEANARLAELRPLLEALRADRETVAESQRALLEARATNGSAEHAEELARRERDIREIVRRMQQTVSRLNEWDVVLRDIAAGLVDFPALVNGRPIWLCWRLGEDTVDWWHETDAGFEQRKPLMELT